MKIIHTSDWHLGRYLNKMKKRYDEFEAFLDWLAETVDRREAEALIVAGDVFDNTTPTHKAQELYYDFLRRILVRSQCCRHAVIVGGNHDSPSFLEAPSNLLRGLGAHVIGAKAWDNPLREVLPLRDREGRLELIVCAAPFLRESDLRLAEMGDGADERHQKIVLGLGEHYRELAEEAQRLIAENGRPVPVVATGHLFFKGSSASDDDGVRDIHAGPLSALPLDVLPHFDYLALGHLHTAQCVGKRETARYSGSPIPMGFNEAAQTKSVCLVDFGAPGQTLAAPTGQALAVPTGQALAAPTVELIPVPSFRTLKRLEGDVPTLLGKLKALKGQAAWVELVHTGPELEGDYRHLLDEAVEGTGLEILSVKDVGRRALTMSIEDEAVPLGEMSLADVFDRLLKDREVPEDQWPALREAHARLVGEMETEDVLAE
ncbi:MAG: exonuclease SbcCD subunit D C-terminal domain-containing protein [Deltaproteobacteria bacterium]|jgi:exonuclease SbcD|nr:exonuclease SbcCD subunit D C-terminal domain-containing protein [Deltaproteobacteria bacterium]